MLNRFWIVYEGRPVNVAIGGGDNLFVYVPELDVFVRWDELYSTKEGLDEAQATAA